MLTLATSTTRNLKFFMFPPFPKKKTETMNSVRSDERCDSVTALVLPGPNPIISFCFMTFKINQPQSPVWRFVQRFYASVAAVVWLGNQDKYAFIAL
jgi:hypothetical protein